MRSTYPTRPAGLGCLCLLAALLLAGGKNAQATSLTEFGFQSMRVDGQPALGTRPLLLIIANFAGAVATALAAAILTLVALNFRRLPNLRSSMDAGANAAVLPAFSVASLVGFGALAFFLVEVAQAQLGDADTVRLERFPNQLAAKPD